MFTLDIPQETGASNLIKAAVALYDARLLSQGQAEEMAGVSRVELLDALSRQSPSFSTPVRKNCWWRRLDLGVPCP